MVRSPRAPTGAGSNSRPRTLVRRRSGTGLSPKAKTKLSCQDLSREGNSSCICIPSAGPAPSADCRCRACTTGPSEGNVHLAPLWLSSVGTQPRASLAMNLQTPTQGSLPRDDFLFPPLTRPSAILSFPRHVATRLFQKLAASYLLGHPT